MFETTVLHGTTEIKYILWFEQTISESKLAEIKEAVKKLGISAEVISGCKTPNVVELQALTKGE